MIDDLTGNIARTDELGPKIQALVNGIEFALGVSFFAKYSTDIASVVERKSFHLMKPATGFLNI